MNKETIITNICYTTLVYDRINKKLATNLSKLEIEALILKVLTETHKSFFLKKGKNFYVSNTLHKIRITINSNTYRVITVDHL
ncbi:MAG: DUF3781 domain-containing protein [Flavobacteriaceae bacterium]|nr:DUF3781 domain-containing protein [Flavobacteriaceae bacterium]